MLAGSLLASHLMIAGEATAGVADGPLARPVLAAAGAVGPDPGRYGWPLSGAVSRSFEPPAIRWLPGHRGVDLVGAEGAVVRAPGDGVVRFAGPVAGRGVVSVDHPDGLRTTFQPLVPVVSAGDPVARGDPLGVLLAGHPGCPVPACLHWGVRQGEHYVDPLALLGLGRARLLPP